METTIYTQNFGVEIEMTGLTRKNAAEVIAKHYGLTTHYIGTYYDTYGATDTKGRTWKAMSDGSINTQVISNGHRCSAGHDYSCEVVTPILQYDDIEDLQGIIRELVEAGAIVNSSCGIHVHVDGAAHDAASLTRLMNFAIGRQDLFYEALNVGDRERQWCHKMNRTLLNAMKKDSEKTKASLERIWYSAANDNYVGGVDHEHYNRTRYHGINLHAYFTKGTVEFRLFNGTLHAGKIKAYIQFCLAMSAWAVNAKDDLFFKNISEYTTEQKKEIMNRMLKKRLGMSGPEFKTARLHLTSAFTTAA